jgi:hypothetical protein
MRLILVALPFVLCFGVWAEEKAATWSFDKDEAGSLAKGFTNETGKWLVAKDDSAPSPPNVLAQTASNAKRDFNVCLVAASSYQDVDLSVKLKAIAGEIDQGGGLVWRARDAKNYYIARFNPLEDDYRLFKVVDGVRTLLLKADAKLPAGWHTLRVVMSGAQIECSLDGQKYLNAKDETFKDAGKIGLWTKADAQTHFDDLTASVPAGK